MANLKCLNITEEFSKLTGNFNLAILLSQFILWSEVSNKKDNSQAWFKKSIEDMKEDSLFLCDDETICKNIDELANDGWLSVKIDISDGCYYRINKEIISESLSKLGYSFDDVIYNLLENCC